MKSTTKKDKQRLNDCITWRFLSLLTVERKREHTTDYSFQTNRIQKIYDELNAKKNECKLHDKYTSHAYKPSNYSFNE